MLHHEPIHTTSIDREVNLFFKTMYYIVLLLFISRVGDVKFLRRSTF